MMVRNVVLCLLMVTLCAAQREPAPSSGFTKPAPAQPPAAPVQKPAAPVQAPATAAPKPAPPAAPAAKEPPAAEAPKTAPVAGSAESGFVLNLQNAALPQVVDILARRLRMNYILDPRVKGTVTLNTYGEIKRIDTRTLLETILRINGAAMVQVGDIYRIVPVADAGRLPLTPQTDPKNLSEDERMTLNLIFLKYATVAELSKLIEPFLGEGAKLVSYEPANLLLILDNARSMRRTMDLLAVFDNDTLASQRVRLFEVKHGRPSDLARELEGVMKAVSLGGEKANSAVRFLPIDRINMIVAIAPNPGVFAQVEDWLNRLDLEPKVTAGTVDNYVYRVKYGWAQMLSMAIMQLYTGYSGYGGYGMGMGGYGMGMSGMGMGMGGYGMSGMGMSGMGMSGMGMGGMGMGGYGMGGMGMGGMGMGGYGMGGYGMGGYGMGGYGMGGYGMGGYGNYQQSAMPYGQQPAVTTPPQTASTGAADQTGNYLSAGTGYGVPPASRVPRVIPNAFDNTLLIQATPQDYQQILKLLEQLDVAPRQVLIEAKIYEVNMQGDFSAGVQAYLQHKNAALPAAFNGRRQLQGATATASDTAANLTLTAGMLVGNSRQLLGILTANESNNRAKLVSAPSIIATDSIAASLNVGASVPTLSGTLQSGLTGTGSVATAVQNVQTGVTLNVIARVTPSGIITLKIEQQVSAPVAPAAGAAIQTPSFQNRTMSTQVTVQDGDTVAIGGIILDSDTLSSAGIPFLHRIPVIGAAFGSKSVTKDRTELVIFFTPRVIYDTNQITDATEEIKSRFRKLRPMIQE